MPGQEDGGLPGRVRAADDVDVLARAGGGLGERGPVVDPAPGHLVEPGRAELPVRDPGGEDDGVCVDGAAVGEADRARRAVDVEADHVAGGEQLGAEPGGLPPRPLGQLRPGHPVREPEVVLDPRALARLAAGGGALHQHGAQPLGRAVYRGAQAGRAAADDDEVVEILRRGGGQADAAGQLGVGRLDQRVPIGGDHHRQPEPVGPGRLHQPLAVGRLGFEPAVGDLVAGEELADLGGARRPAVPDHLGHVDRVPVLLVPLAQ